MFRGQAWVSLHGDFTVEELKALTLRIDELCKGLEKHDSTGRPDDRLEPVSEDN